MIIKLRTTSIGTLTGAIPKVELVEVDGEVVGHLIKDGNRWRAEHHLSEEMSRLQPSKHKAVEWLLVKEHLDVMDVMDVMDCYV